jgi:hypothetical protein
MHAFLSRSDVHFEAFIAEAGPTEAMLRELRPDSLSELRLP